MKRKVNLLHYSFTYTCIFLLLNISVAVAQPRENKGMSPEAYNTAKEVKIDDLDNDTYVKVADGNYVLDRYDMKPPYFITGDSGVKKRIDIYKFLDRETMSELGLVAFFTNTETNTTFNLVIPNLMSPAEVWNIYFDDIHQHDREENDVALKMSYVLSKEVAYLMQKSSGVDMSALDESNSDYDFCFPATALVTLSDGSRKTIAELAVGEEVAAYENGQMIRTKIESIKVHKRNNITLSRALLTPEETVTAATSGIYHASATELIATANHPVVTEEGKKAMEDLKAGDVVYYFNQMTLKFERYQVFLVNNNFDTIDKVYNLTTQHSNYIVNDVVVSEK